jgi:hypothetical protein
VAVALGRFAVVLRPERAPGSGGGCFYFRVPLDELAVARAFWASCPGSSPGDLVWLDKSHFERVVTGPWVKR